MCDISSDFVKITDHQESSNKHSYSLHYDEWDFQRNWSFKLILPESYSLSLSLSLSSSKFLSSQLEPVAVDISKFKTN